jgi:hypothetical protein
MEEPMRTALNAIDRRDWVSLERVLHPYVHWTENGSTVRGRKNVLAHLAGCRAVHQPTSHELRDGQIYRWTIQGGQVTDGWAAGRLPRHRHAGPIIP